MLTDCAKALTTLRKRFRIEPGNELNGRTPSRRRFDTLASTWPGAATVPVVLLLVTLLGVATLALGIGHTYSLRAELQKSRALVAPAGASRLRGGHPVGPSAPRYSSPAVNVGHTYDIRAELQKAVEATALAGASQLHDEDAVRAIAQECVILNQAGQRTLLAEFDTLIGNWDAETRTFTEGREPFNAVKVMARRPSVARTCTASYVR